MRLQRGLKFYIGMYREFFFNLLKNHLDRKAVTSMETSSGHAGSVD